MNRGSIEAIAAIDQKCGSVLTWRRSDPHLTAAAGQMPH